MVQILIIIAGFTYLAAQAQANTIIVNVGEGGLNYKPDSVTAVKGDTVEFVFAAQGVSLFARTYNFGLPEMACLLCATRQEMRNETNSRMYSRTTLSRNPKASPNHATP